MATFKELQLEADERKLIRKVQRAVAFLLPDDVPLPESLYDGGELIDIKALGGKPVGMVTPDGYEFGREVENETVDALGYASEVREDVVRVARSVTFTPLETGRKHMLELKYGVNLDDVTVDPTTGAFQFDEPDMPVNEEYGLIIVGADGPASDQWLLGRGYGSVKLSEGGEETWGSENPVGSSITLKILPDDVTGTPVRHYFGGTGVLKHVDEMGFALGTGTGGSGE